MRRNHTRVEDVAVEEVRALRNAMAWMELAITRPTGEVAWEDVIAHAAKVEIAADKLYVRARREMRALEVAA